MDPARPGIPESQSRGHRVLRHFMGGTEIPFLQADAHLILQINGRFNDHFCNLTKFFKIARPTSPLFSGWNWVPYTFPLPTAATTSAP